MSFTDLQHQMIVHLFESDAFDPKVFLNSFCDANCVSHLNAITELKALFEKMDSEYAQKHLHEFTKDLLIERIRG
jgi:hypothetical protein